MKPEGIGLDILLLIILIIIFLPLFILFWLL